MTPSRSRTPFAPSRSPTVPPLLLSTASAFFSLSLLLLLLLPAPTHAILPTGAIDVTSPRTGERYTLLASQAGFGSYPGMNPNSNPLMEVIVPPQDDTLLCLESEGKANYSSPSYADYADTFPSWSATDYGGSPSDDKKPLKAMLVPRGSCTFERKALSAQRLGAAAVIVYGTLSSRYALNVTKLSPNATEAEKRAADNTVYTISDVLWPADRYDYDCSYGRAEVPTSVLSFNPLPYDGTTNDAKLTGTAEEGNLCALNSVPLQSTTSTSSSSSSSSTTSSIAPGFLGSLFSSQSEPVPFTKSCPSQRCLLTGKRSTGTTSRTRGMTVMEACCAWDNHVWLYADPSVGGGGSGSGSGGGVKETVTIPAFYVSMAQGKRLLDTYAASTASDNNNGGGGGNGGGSGGDGTDGTTAAPVGLTLYARWEMKYNPSSFLIWAMGCAVCYLAAWMSASDYRNLRRDVDSGRRKDARVEMTLGGGTGGVGMRSDEEDWGEEEENNFVQEGINGGGLGGGYGQVSIEESDIPPGPHREGGGGSVASSGHSSGVRSRSRSRTPPKRSSSADQAQAQYRPPSEQYHDRPAAAAAAGGGNGHPTSDYRHLDSRHSSAGDESLELNASHALGFIVMASFSLTVLFVFKIYNVVKIMYAFGCSGAVTQVLFLPLYDKIGSKIGWKSRHRMAFHAGSEFGPVTYLDVLSALSGYGLGLTWLIVAFVAIHPEDDAFFWITQDVMGGCMCILFLSVIKLNSIKVASILLIVAFAYDIFFVFVTPLLTRGGKSVMITVATSGGPPKADPSWCEKYPRDADCAGGDPLPMLLTVPRIMDYQGGASLLGLGDIVLPGLLLSFAARFDEAKKLVVGMATTTTATGGAGGGGGRGYLVPVTIAYGIGLLMANAAVYLMQMGQPALLYLVPCCLGTMTFLGWRRDELTELWDGPQVVRAADALLYGEGGEDYIDGGGGGGAGGGAVDEGGEGGGGEGGDGYVHREPTVVVIPGGDGDSSSQGSGSNRGDVPLLSSRKRRGSGGGKGGRIVA